MAVGALAVPAPLRLEVRAVAEGGEVPQRAVADDHDVAAAAAVAAVRPALGHVRLAAQRDDAVAAGAGLHVNRCAIAEHGPAGPAR